jgi:signal transduction histidine kinase
LRKHQNIITELPDSLPDLYADQDRIGQVIQNLLDNASKFTRKGGTIPCGQDSVTSCGSRSGRFGLRDKPGRKQYIFEPYSRLRHNWKGESGLGLGLHLSRVFIELHGGKIWFESDQGHGSRFVFSLPVYYRQSGENINDNGHNER